MANTGYPPSRRGRALALAASLFVIASAVGQTPSQDGKQAMPPAKATKSAKPAKKPVVPKYKLVLEPKAMDLLKATSERLAAAKSMTFTATVGYEFPSKFGPPLVYTMRYDVTMERPDKLRILMPGDGPASEFYYDGKTMMAYAPAENLVAVADAPPTIDAALMAAYNTAADILSVHRPPCGGSVCCHDRRGDPRVLHRAVGRGRRREDGNGGVGQQRRVPANLDWRRRQAATAGTRDLRSRSDCSCATSWRFRTGNSIRRSRRTRSRRRKRWRPRTLHLRARPRCRQESSHWSRCRRPRRRQRSRSPSHNDRRFAMKTIVTVTQRADRRRGRHCGPVRRPAGTSANRAGGSTSHSCRINQPLECLRR